MIKSNTFRFYYLLISLCLLLLLSFLGYWNFNQYQENVARLTKNSQLRFENAVREVEDGIWRSKLLTNFIDVEVEDPNGKAIFAMSQTKDDSTHNHDGNMFIGIVDTVIQNATTKARNFVRREIKRDSNYVFHSEGEVIRVTQGRTEDFSGMMSLYVAVSKKSHDSLQVDLLDSLMFDIVVEKLNGNGEGRLKVIKLSNQEDSLRNEGIYTGKYTDLVTGEKYIGKVEEYKWGVIKSMWPQGLFSIFLFAITALAFFYIMRSLRQQERSSTLKNDFISNMTHELKTPITTVGVALEALSSFNGLKDPKRTEEYIDISQKELSRLSILVDKVLNMALFEKKEPELKLEQIDLKQLVSEVVNSMKLHFDKFSGKYNLNFSGENFEMDGDKIHLTSVIYNLIDNALKYSPDTPKIAINLNNHPEHLVFSVADNGVGIDPEFKERIFEKFFRIPTGDRHNIKGYGLGLAYVAGVVRKHKGTITFESEPGRGTTFTINLPRRHE